MRKFLSYKLHSESTQRGSSLIEFTLLVALVAIVPIASMQDFSESTHASYCKASWMVHYFDGGTTGSSLPDPPDGILDVCGEYHDESYGGGDSGGTWDDDAGD